MKPVPASCPCLFRRFCLDAALIIGVFVLDPDQDAQGRALTRVQVFSAEGDFLRSWAIGPEFDGQAMAVGSDGTLYVVR